MPGYRKNDYQLVLMPHQELRERINGVRIDFAEKFKTNRNTSPGYLTLARFTQIEMLEERIINRLKTVAMGFQPFKVEIQDYMSYPTHSIFLNVTTRLPFKELMKELKPARQLMKLGTSEPHFLDQPGFIIAGKLLAWQYEQAWNEYRHRKFTAKFIADSMLLLKRRDGDRRFQVVANMDFLNLPVATKQGELFGV